MNDAHCGEDAKTIDALREENARLRGALERLVRALKADLIAAGAVGLPAPIPPGSPSDAAFKRAESALGESR